jgi:hypothetical protein
MVGRNMMLLCMYLLLIYLFFILFFKYRCVCVCVCVCVCFVGTVVICNRPIPPSAGHIKLTNSSILLKESLIP